MTYSDIASSLVFLAGLVFLFVCGMTVLAQVALEAYKTIYIRIKEAERQIAAIEKTADLRAFEESKVCD